LKPGLDTFKYEKFLAKWDIPVCSKQSQKNKFSEGMKIEVERRLWPVYEKQ
jgi:hypothetical protein